MFCMFCGKNIDTNSKFCKYCGKELKYMEIIKSQNFNKYYIPRKCIMTQNELLCYKVLLEIAKELNLILLCQVSLYSIVSSKNQYDGSFNKIKSKSIDYVLITKKSGEIKLCIELDDTTHNQPNRIERDIFIDQLFENLKINLLRIKCEPIYSLNEVRRQIKRYIKE